MARYIITPREGIGGEVCISGSKNAALPILAAAMLSDEPSLLSNVPELLDTNNMLSLIRSVGGKAVRVDKNMYSVCLDGRIKKNAASDTYSKLRASILLLGVCLARGGSAKIPLPGGCRIGSRPIDLHLKGFKALGAKLRQGHGYVEAKCDRLRGGKIYLDFPSVGATENIMIAAALADGVTVIENAAAEPEITDLADFLNGMGADIKGAGGDAIYIEGKQKLHGCVHRVIPDRIEAGTFLISGAILRSGLRVRNIVPSHLKPLTAKLEEMGAELKIAEDNITVAAASGRLKAVDIKTMPYPGFPTDMQAQMTSLISTSEGSGIVTETVFENRFMHVSELCRMGAKIKTDGSLAVVNGVKKLSGAKVKATDLRAGAALVIAALAADGKSEICDIEHIERGYENFCEKLSGIGADIKREET